ncbi:clathrin coat assembly protein [Stylonychia lemnae]|uniref:Clathrin coat assembly protein n=1 Tax=Stylonychia lemnae TaxID=5949 RepID=A0A077ZQW2_STYLE|nr:clathrin coat assembly protein [Stylonychia lemnae]|eukprot:CDW72292.1 clathrin coat assembly protein [Stylonychia lemnae]
MGRPDSTNTTNLLTLRKDSPYRKRYSINLNLIQFLDKQYDYRQIKQTNPLLGMEGLQDCVQKVIIAVSQNIIRYASLYFAAGIEKNDNELIVLDIIHHFVETLDRYFGNVCELDLIFNFHQAYFILEEIIIGGFIMESSKKQVLKMIQQNDALMDEAFFKDEGQGKNQKEESSKGQKQ